MLTNEVCVVVSSSELCVKKILECSDHFRLIFRIHSYLKIDNLLGYGHILILDNLQYDCII